MHEDWRTMYISEQAILARLLEPSFPGREELMVQLVYCRVRTIDSEGSFSIQVLEGKSAPVNRRIPIEAEVEDTDKIIIHMLLHVVDGWAKELEIYKDDGSEILSPIDALKLQLLQLD
jgi:hypothetical protein